MAEGLFKKLKCSEFTMLVSSVQQSGSVVYIHMHTYIYMYNYFFRFFSIIGYYKINSIVPCALQQVLVVYFIYSSVYMLIPN